MAQGIALQGYAPFRSSPLLAGNHVPATQLQNRAKPPRVPPSIPNTDGLTAVSRVKLRVMHRRNCDDVQHMTRWHLDTVRQTVTVRHSMYFASWSQSVAQFDAATFD